MENPNRSSRHSLAMIAFGILIGAIPGLIHVDQMRRQLQSETAEAQKLSDEARKQIAEAMGDATEAKRQMQACQNAIIGDGSETIIVTQNHPYAGWQQKISGITLMVPQPDSPVIVSPVLIVRGNVAPRALDGITGAVYTHIWPDGRTDGWKAPSRAE